MISWAKNLRPTPKVALVLKLTTFLVVIYQLIRICFYLFNREQFSDISMAELAFAFLHGTRFDLYSALWLNAPLFLAILFFPSKWQSSKIFRRVSLAWLFLVNCFFLGWNLGDWEFVNFTGKRTTMDIFFLAEDVGGMGLDIVTYYWFQTLLSFSFFALAFFGFRRIVKNYNPMSTLIETKKQWSWTVVFVILIGIGMRGGWQLKPIRPVNAYTGVSQKTGILVLNTTFTMLRSKRSGEFQSVHYFDSFEDVMATLEEGKGQRPQSFGEFKGFNVVLIILESFSQEYTGLVDLGLPSYTPFLDELSKRPRARTFTQHFASGRRSIDAVPSLLSGIPTLMSEPFISSNFQTNRIIGWGDTLSQLGYETSFFHGAKNGSMYFDSFSAQAGFHHYYGLNEYPNVARDDDGSWGIYDEPFFQFTAETLTESKKPFAAVLFSLSSHHPYHIPDKYNGQFPKGAMDIHQSIGYTDFALKRFFESAEKTDWYNNTIFFITADHTSKTVHPTSQTLYGGHRVPLVIYAPGKDLPPHPGFVFTQHIDVPKTIYGLLGATPARTTLFGADVFALSEAEHPGEVYNFSYPGYWYLNKQGLFRFDDHGQIQSHENPSDLYLKKQVTDNTEQWVTQRMRAWLQYYNNGLINNLWFQKAKTQP